MSIKDRLIQYVFRGKNELSPEARKIAEDLAKVRNAGKELAGELDKAKGAQGLVVGLRNTQRAVEQAEKAIVQGDLQIRELREALDKSPEAAGLQQSLRDAEREARRAQRQLTALTSGLAEQEEAARAAGIDTSKLAEEEKRLASEMNRAKAAITENSEQLRDLERQQRAATRSAAEHKSRVDAARESMARGAKQVLGFAAAYVSLNAAANLVQKGLNLVRDGIRSMLDTGSEFELMQQRVTGLMGSIEDGERATAWIAQFAKDTGQLIPDVTEAFATLKAFGLDPMDGSLQAITDKSVQLGGGMERLQGITAALGQMWAKEKIQQEEVLQLTERGVVVWPLLEKAMGKTTLQLQEMAQKGQLGRDAVRLLIEEIGKSADGEAAKGLDTLAGKYNRLSNIIGDFYNRIADSGALDYVKDQLQGVADTIDEWDRDGRLDQLATSFSNAFVQGAEWVKDFVSELVKVDFEQLTSQATGFFNNFGTAIDDATMRVKLFFAPFRTLFNGVTAGISSIGYAATRVADGVLQVIGGVATAIPDMLGGDKLRAGVQSARNMLFSMCEGFVAQIEQDGQDIRNAWDTTAKHGVKSQQDVAAAAAAAEKAKREAAEATAAKVEELNERFKQSAVDAAVAGTRAITDMADAMKLIDTASTVDQLEGLKQALQDAYRAGSITQEEYNAGLNLTNEQIRKLTPAAAGAAASLDDLVKSLEGFADLQQAIKGAETDVDISKLGTATRKMYSEGKLTAEEYRKALAELEKQKAEVKKTTEGHSQSEQALASSINQVTQAIDKKKAAEQADREAAAQASAERAREVDAWGAYFDSVMTSAREPLAALSEQALAAFDSIRGITGAELSIDTSGIEATRTSLGRLQDSMAKTQRELADNLRGPFAQWASEQIAQSQQIQQQYLKQKLALQELMDRYERGVTTLAGFRQGAMSLKGSLTLLDDSDLSQLQSAIASAEQQMRSLGDSARSTLDGVRDELDRVRGNEEAIERRRMESRRRELQAQLAEARGTGNSQAVNDLQQAIGMLNSIESEQRLAREQAERDNRREPTQATGPAGATQQAATPAAPSTVIRLESARGTAVDVAVPTGQEDALLSILEQAGMRTI
ncbi:tape measure protein [Halopseudomonas bauzanensis]|uniref:tape measure protein n=1 Tax=Halopseudomonas bauzanensis TaxID=653930 RepID=UPI003524DC0E